MASRTDFHHFNAVILNDHCYRLRNASNPRRFVLKPERNRRVQNEHIGEFHAETMNFVRPMSDISPLFSQGISDFHDSTFDFLVDPLGRDGQTEMPYGATLGG